MRALLYTIVGLLGLVALATAFNAHAQGISQLQQFTSTTSPQSAITQTVFGKALRLTGQNSGCAQFSANGTLTSSGSSCGGGFSYPFPSNATSTALSFTGGITASALTISGLNGILKASSGVVSGSANTSDLPEGANLYWTNTRFDSRLSATTTLPNVTTLASLSLPYSQLTGTPTLFSYPFPSNATSTSIAFNGGLTGVLTGSLVGNASTATALAANGTNCLAGNYPLGVDASGNVENCTAAGGFSYPFPSNATSTSIAFNGGLTANAGTITSASTTNLTASGFFQLPNSSSQSPTIAGACAIDTTSGQLKCGDGSATRVMSDGYFYPAFSYSTSTAWTGTTTIALGPSYTGETWSGAKCFTDAGTLQVSFNDGTNRMNWIQASTTVGTVTLSTNNTFTASEKRYVDIGTPASSPTKISCTIRKAITSD
jgi:hypothetical protein